jgi:hypothetical protein
MYTDYWPTETTEPNEEERWLPFADTWLDACEEIASKRRYSAEARKLAKAYLSASDPDTTYEAIWNLELMPDIGTGIQLRGGLMEIEYQEV